MTIGIVLFFLLFNSGYSYAQAVGRADSTYYLTEVAVDGKDVRQAHRLGEQTIDRHAIRRRHADQLSDVVKHFSGAQIKDYGGIGGLKTISIRSLGASHTAVTIDGVPVSDLQNGQIDLSKISLEKIESVRLTQGSSMNLFQPASAYASAATLHIESMRPSFDSDKSFRLSAALRAGSYGYFQPSLHWQHKITSKIALDFSSNWTTAEGDYPYRVQNINEVQEGRREYSRFESTHQTMQLFGSWSQNHRTDIRFNYYENNRQLPGSIVFYYAPKGQELWERVITANATHTSHWKVDDRNHFRLRGSFKWNRSNTRYKDDYYLNAEGLLYNHYEVDNSYLSLIGEYATTYNWRFTLSSDIDLATISRSQQATRVTNNNALGVHWNNRTITAEGGVVFPIIIDSNTKLSVPNHTASPFLNFEFALPNRLFSMQVGYKESLRMPSFNELYYTDMGTRQLKPEHAQMFNLAMQTKMTRDKLTLQIQAELFKNQVRDKIVGIPSKNLFVWTIVNMGKVDIEGATLTSSLNWSLAKQWSLISDLSYTYQQARDVTDPESQTYLHQIAYTPRHTGAVALTLYTPWFGISYNLIGCSSRYSQNQNLPMNFLPSYIDQSIGIMRSFAFDKHHLRLSVECLNFTNQNYEIVRNYPMPGLQVRCAVAYTFQ